ncbi:hypothetical protein SUGI_0339460 [Cryptomeria japonica]|nr:hypothetical protein SUGI_0339460 [Cryptomeria japonica]
MNLNNMEKSEHGLTVCYSPVKRKRKYSCRLALFNGNACSANNSSSGSTDPAEELKEKDLIRCLMKSYKSPKYNSFVSFSPDVDCTLSLGMSHPLPTPDEQRCMDMYKKSSMEEVIEVIKSTLFPPKVKCSEVEASDVPFGGLHNISSSVNNSVHKSSWSTATNAATTSKDILVHTNIATNLISKVPPKNHKDISSSNPVSNDNGSSMRNITSDELAKWCSTCHTTGTPLWRSGPNGAKSLCDACGIRYKKRERRAASAMAAAKENNNQFQPHR